MAVVIYDATTVPTEVDAPDDWIWHIDLPWMTVVSKVFHSLEGVRGSGIKLCLHGDLDVMEGEDWLLALSFVPDHALRLPIRFDTRTLGVENEIFASYWYDRAF